MKTRKANWFLGKHQPFKDSFDKLIPQDKWRVAHAVQELIFEKEPQKKYPHVQCTDCGVDESYHLSAVAHDGTGNMGVELLFKINKTTKVLSPIYTRRTRLVNSKKLLVR